MEAYKSPAEVNFMPYLDAGFIGMSVYYASTAICGAIALGHYDKMAINIKKSNNIFI